MQGRVNVKQPKNEHGYCSSCGADWDGDEIPEDLVPFSGSGRWGRQVMYEDRKVYDGIIAVCCPDCEHLEAYGAGKLQVSEEDTRTVFEKWQAGEYK